MTDAIRNLDTFFSPRSVAVVGASATPTKIGAVPLGYLLEKGYAGEVYPINPTRDEVQGKKAYASLTAVGKPIDLAIFAIPAAHVDAAIEDAIAAGVKNIVMFSAGFAETGEAGAEAQQRFMAKARAAGIRLLGPNCLGFMNIRKGVYASFSPVLSSGLAGSGSVGIVSQSGAFGAYAYGLARQRNVGLSTWVTTGNEADVQVSDCIQWMAEDPATKVIMAYMEGCQDGVKLKRALSKAREAGKPVVIVKVGRTELGAMAAASHTAALAGNDASYDALFKQYGVWRAKTIDEFFDIGHALSVTDTPPNGKVGLLTVSGGVGVMMADDADEAGLDVAPMPEEAQQRILERVPFAATRNPVDITGQVTSDLGLLNHAAGLMLKDGGYGSLLVFLAAAGLNARMQVAQKEMAQYLRAEFPDRVVVFSTLSEERLERELEELGCLSFEEPSRAIRVLAALQFFREQRSATVPAPRMKEEITLEARTYDEADGLELLRQYHVPGANVMRASSREEASQASAALGYPLVMKVLSSEITHKSDVGGVMLNLRDEAQVLTAYDHIRDNVATRAPNARVSGVLLAPMVSGGVECILGVHRDATLGHMVMLGAGGVNVELIRDVTFRVAPVGMDEAYRMIGELKTGALLDGFRGAPKADKQALAQAIVRLSEFAVAAGDSLESIDLNPFVVLPEGQGALALDAVVVGRADEQS